MTSVVTSRASLAQALLAPRTVALVGASGDATKNTARPQRYLRAHGYRGRVIPVNPVHRELFGVPAWPDIASAPMPIDHAFVMVPARNVEDVVAACGDKGIPLVTVYSDGFAERGPVGALPPRASVARPRRHGTRLLGPNAIGVIAPPSGLALSVNAVLDMPSLLPGRLGLVSQSGSLIGAILSRGQARGIGFSALVSVGNEGDVTVGEVADVFVEDAGTDAILLFLETIRDAPRLADACRRAAQAGKPVVAYLLGRSDVGRALAVSHTGALAGSAEALGAWLDAQGVVRVDQFETLIEIAPLLRQTRPPAGRRVGVLSTTGGGAAMVVDRIDDAYVEIVPPTPAMIESLAGEGVHIGSGPVTDLTLAGTRREVYSRVLDAYLRSDACDTVLAVVGSSAQFHPQHAVRPIIEADRCGKAMAAFATPAADEALALFAQAGIPAFRTPEACADALRALARWREPLPPSLPQGNETAAVAAAADRLRTLGTAACDEASAREVFAALGIDTGAWLVVGEQGAARSPPLPAAVKVLSADVPHKTDIGGVRLGCERAGDVDRAVAEVCAAARAAHPEAVLRGALVQQMESGIGEAIVGYRRDPQVGPTVLVGVGGIHAEVYRDVAVRPAPVSEAEAARMIDEVRGLAVLRGWRGTARGDVAALATAIRRLSLLACIPDVVVREAEINPLLVRREGRGAVALDALLVADTEGSR
ncbi:MAG: acetate--CoA ligase family protein [Burkholderiales bacterium]|nr:acetate--CoA ligase family protein [Burkholderiales bacterium]